MFTSGGTFGPNVEQIEQTMADITILHPFRLSTPSFKMTWNVTYIKIQQSISHIFNLSEFIQITRKWSFLLCCCRCLRLCVYRPVFLCAPLVDSPHKASLMWMCHTSSGRQWRSGLEKSRIPTGGIFEACTRCLWSEVRLRVTLTRKEMHWYPRQ